MIKKSNVPKVNSLGEQNSFLNKLTPISDESIEGFIGDMLSAEDTPTKTEVNEPTVLTQMEIYAQLWRLQGFEDAAKLIELWVEKFRVNMISKKRKSRTEVVQMVSEINRERSQSERLTSVPEKGKA
jgi:hypothetical protein